MTLSVSGLGSGIDVDSIVSQLMQVAQRPLTDLNNKKSAVTAASQTLSSISGRLSSLKTAALALTTATGFSSFGASSSDSSSVVGKVVGGATPGSYSVTVSQLAAAQKSRSQAQPSSTSALGATGSLSIAMGAAAPIAIAVAPSDTLADLASKISTSGARVAASIMNDGTGYRLLVQGLDSGAANAFSITETGVSLGLSDPTSTYQTAADAHLTVDGMAVTSATNQVGGVIAGVKLGLAKVTASPVVVDVATDPTALETKVKALVSAYNDFVNSSHNATGFGGKPASSSVLASDQSVRTALTRLGGIVGATVPGTSGRYTTLASVGIATKDDGTLSFDATKLEAALADDPSTVQRLFVTDPLIGATGMMKTLMETVDGLVSGASSPIMARINGLGAQTKQLTDSAERLQTRLDAYQTQLKAKFTAMDIAVSKYQNMLKQLPGYAKSKDSNGGD
jgi:flagellar hook-associated protein 2